MPRRRHLFRRMTGSRALRDGSFGVCEQCGEEIHRKRLLAVPWTAFCNHCQEELDRERRQVDGAGLDRPEHMRGADAA